MITTTAPHDPGSTGSIPPGASLGQSEPAIKVTTITTLIAAVLVLGAQFGISIPDGTADAITGVVLAFWPVITAWQIRSRVYAPDTTASLIVTAHEQGANAIPLRRDPEMRQVLQGNPATAPLSRAT